MTDGRILNVIKHIQPQLIITTHALLSYAVARANEKSRKRVPLVFQLTDLGRLHMTWFIEKHADAYLTPTNEIFVQALNKVSLRIAYTLQGGRYAANF